MNLKRLIAVCTRQSIEKVPFKHFFSYVFVNANVFPQMFKKKLGVMTILKTDMNKKNHNL